MPALLHQTVGFADDNENPTEAHINEALEAALKMPAASRLHNRVWLPHREEGDVVSQFWTWLEERTHAATCKNTITNCGHIALWVIQPEDDDAPLGWYPNYPQGYFEGGLFTGPQNFSEEPVLLNDFFRNYSMGIAISAMKYAEVLSGLGYDVGFLSVPSVAPVSFNSHFGQYFSKQPVVPMLMIYAGTKGNAIKHSYHRNKISNTTVETGSVIKLDLNQSDIPSNWGYKNLHYWEDDTRSTLLPHTANTVVDFNYCKRSNNFQEGEIMPGDDDHWANAEWWTGGNN